MVQSQWVSTTDSNKRPNILLPCFEHFNYKLRNQRFRFKNKTSSNLSVENLKLSGHEGKLWRKRNKIIVLTVGLTATQTIQNQPTVVFDLTTKQTQIKIVNQISQKEIR